MNQEFNTSDHILGSKLWNQELSTEMTCVNQEFSKSNLFWGPADRFPWIGTHGNRPESYDFGRFSHITLNRISGTNNRAEAGTWVIRQPARGGRQTLSTVILIRQGRQVEFEHNVVVIRQGRQADFEHMVIRQGRQV